MVILQNQNNCGTYIRATSLFLILGCPTYKSSTGLISIYYRQLSQGTLTFLTDISGPYPGAMFGQGSSPSKGFQLVWSDYWDPVFHLQIATMVGNQNIAAVISFIFYD